MNDRSRSRPSSARSTQGLSSNPSLRADEAFGRARADMEAVFQEGTELEHQGKLDEDATKRIEARLQQISESLDTELANGLAELAGSGATRSQAVWKTVAGVLLLVAFIGIPLEFTLGESFVFSYANTYKSFLPLLFAVTLPIFAVLWFRLEQTERALSYRSPTWAVRWLVVFPLVVVTSSSMLVFSPFGWSALAGWAIGTQSQAREAKVLSIETARRRAGKCDQKAMLDIDQIQVNICIEDRVIGPAPKVGDTVSVLGRRSSLGLFIVEIRVKLPS